MSIRVDLHLHLEGFETDICLTSYPINESDLAWEIFVLAKDGEWDLVEKLLRALVADSRGDVLPPSQMELINKDD